MCAPSIDMSSVCTDINGEIIAGACIVHADYMVCTMPLKSSGTTR